MRNDPDIVSATEIAEWVYCPEAFRLQALGHKSANRRERAWGTRHHTCKAFAERIATAFIAFGRILILAALAAWVLSR